MSENDKAVSKAVPLSQIVFIIVRTMIRVYFVYLIFSFVKRVDRGDTLLVEYGSRRLRSMLDELKKEQLK